MRKSFLSVCLAATGLLAPTIAVSAEPALAQPVGVAQAYFEAMDQSDLDAAEALFAESSSVFESGGVQGSWQRYREHHIGPELDEIKSFETTLGEPEGGESADGSMAFVAWPIEYHIELGNGQLIDSKGTVTFVLVKESGKYRIRHLHWSSRPMK